MSRAHLIEGPVGAGKSTYAQELCRHHAAPHLNLDAWMVRLFRPDRPATGWMEWYVERKERCIEQIWDVAREILSAGHDVVLELGLIQRESRRAFYERLDAAGYELTVYVLDAPKELRRSRVKTRNETRGSTYSMDVPDSVFELANDLWEPPDQQERSERDMRFVVR